MRQQTRYRFQNWAQNESCTAKNYYQPETEDELIDLVKTSSKVRVVGTGHSWSAICLSEETLINLDHYNRVLALDKEKLQVTLQPGLKLWQLNEWLDKEGLALKNLGSIAEQSVAGAISTGTHGTGINYQILGSQVESLTLIKANGEKLKLHCLRDKELFDKCIVNLGCLGILSELTLNVVPAFNLADHTAAIPYNEAVDRLDELVANTDHFKMWWFPHTDKMVLYRYQRTTQKANDSRFRQWFMDELVSVNVYRLLLRVGNLNRKWRKTINGLLVQNFNSPLQRIEKSYKVFNVPEPPLHREVEWAFDISVAKNLLREYKQLINSSPHLINFIQEIRFTKADDFALSPCYGRNTIWLGAYNADNFGWKELMNDFEGLAKKYKGRPHWGKEFTRDKAYLKSVYPKYEEFDALRRELDPDGKFTNPYISDIF
jgi:L-gulonolactone oxidase